MSVTAALGFVASGVSCGIKGSDSLDLALVASDDDHPVAAAGIFTTNRAAAAPVEVSRGHLAATEGHVAAVVISSGNANAATGADGIADARRICSLAGTELGVAPTAVLLCQTGLIGIRLPMAPFESGVADLVASRSKGAEAGLRAAQAMMTTDTFPKQTLVQGDGFVVGGMAKGAAMLAPDMATMLAVLTTDAIARPAQLQSALVEAAGTTFNEMTVDGCTSTNDAVITLASGRSGVSPGHEELTRCLREACAELASMMARDAEGGTKVARIVVKGASSDIDAELAARKVAESLLVKCSLNGEDPYWGRVVSELGSAGVPFEMDRIEVAYGGIVVCEQGIAADHDKPAVRAHMKQPSIEITCDMGIGSGVASVLTCDLGYGYIDENRTTS